MLPRQAHQKTKKGLATTASMVKNMKMNNYVRRIPGLKSFSDCLEGYQISFGDEKSRKAFESKMMQPTGQGTFGDVCWNQFEAEHPNWSKEDQEASSSLSWAGGGFDSLPTVEFMNGGTVAFVSEAQFRQLRHNPWICATRATEGMFYLSVNQIDYYVVIPDQQVAAITAAYAS